MWRGLPHLTCRDRRICRSRQAGWASLLPLMGHYHHYVVTVPSLHVAAFSAPPAAAKTIRNRLQFAVVEMAHISAPPPPPLHP